MGVAQISLERTTGGVSMNFMDTTTPSLTPNQELQGPVSKEAVVFTNELVKLGVLRPATHQALMVNNVPLFLIPKPIQPGKFRPIRR